MQHVLLHRGGWHHGVLHHLLLRWRRLSHHLLVNSNFAQSMIESTQAAVLVAMQQGRNLAHQELIAVLRRHMDTIPLDAYLELIALTRKSDELPSH